MYKGVALSVLASVTFGILYFYILNLEKFKIVHSGSTDEAKAKAFRVIKRFGVPPRKSFYCFSLSIVLDYYPF